MRWMVFGIFVLSIGPSEAGARAYRAGQTATGAMRELDHPSRADFLNPGPAVSLRGAARVARLALLPCRTGFQLAALRRDTSILNAGQFAQRCSTYRGVINFN